jgi:hypothetical protein
MLESIEARVERLVLEYAQSVPPGRPLGARLSLQDDLAIESLSLVSLTLRLGDDLGVDVVEQGIEVGNLKTFGDLVQMARGFQSGRTQMQIEKTAEIEETEKHEEKAEATSQDAAPESEFKLTVRKLEMPVRPRGVLAE